MSKGSNPTNVTTTTESEPSQFIKPYYKQAIDAAQDLYENPDIPSFFPNNTSSLIIVVFSKIFRTEFSATPLDLELLLMEFSSAQRSEICIRCLILCFFEYFAINSGARICMLLKFCLPNS